VPVSARIRPYDHVLLDLDGCLWVGDEACEGAADAVTALRESGASLLFLTNNVRHAPEELVRKLWRLGFQASLAEIIPAGAALQFSLAGRRQEGGAAFVIGSRALIDHVAQAGLRVVNNTEFATRADIVIVSDHRGFNYVELRVATQAVLRGAELIGLTRDRTFPMPDGPWPATGSVVAAVEAATGVQARSVGKPEPQLFLTALDRLGEGRALAIGDRLDADVAGARRAGLDSALVLTGATDAAEVTGVEQEADGPTFVADSLAALVLTP
jgi:HAD superfamily hydrolase (TIGR01450 family)